MRYRRLGRTQLRVSVVGIGAWQLGGEWGKNFTPDEVGRMLGRARELGINLVDTAECYGEHLSESLVGQAIASCRQDWIVATKFGHRFAGHMKRTDERSPDQVQRQLERSLRALRTDYIDLYQFHSVRDSEFDNPELWKCLEDARKAGKIRHIGNSVAGAPDPMFQIERSPQAGVEAIQIVYNRLDRRPETKALAACQQMDLGVLARVPLASGLLSGKYNSGLNFGPNDYRGGPDQAQFFEQRLEQVRRIAAEEVPPGVPMAQWALAWCLRNPAVTSVIPGCKDVAQVESNAAAARLVEEL